MKEQFKNLLFSLEISEEIIEKVLENEIFENLITKQDALEETKKYMLESEISSRLSKAQAKNIKACKSLIDLEQITFDGEKISGLDEQINKIIKDNPYLFENLAYTPQSGSSKPSEKNMTDSEYFNFLKLNKNGGF